jgi:hypothetical protein
VQADPAPQQEQGQQAAAIKAEPAGVQLSDVEQEEI